MVNKYIAIPFSIGLTVVFFATAEAIKDRKESELLGRDTVMICDLSKDNCTNVKEREKMPIKIIPPLGLSTAVNQSEINCLARNITQEAVKGYIVDKVYVAWGTINRVKKGHFGKTICEVISKPNQMSWYKNYAKRIAPPAKEDITLAKQVLAGKIPNPSPDCMITNWYNITHDSKNSFNAKQRDRVDVCSKHPKNTPHFYIEDKV